MEVLGFVHVAVDYEDQGPAPQLREFDVQVPKGVGVGLAGSALAVAAAVSAPDAQATVRFGDQCNAVYSVQNELAFNGFLPQSARDGNFGAQTRTAVINYQRFTGLAADGVVGPQTLSRLGLSSSLACGVSGSTGSGSTGGGNASGSFATVTASNLNVRSGPSSTSPVIATLPRGTSVETRRVSGGWTSILSLSPSVEGYVSSQYLSSSGSPGSGSTGGGSTTYFISTTSGGGVNVRSSPNGAVVGSLANGASVSVTNVRQNAGAYQWAQLTNGNWVADTFLSSSGGSTGGGSPSSTGVVSASGGINVRSSPNGPVVGSLPNGATVRFTSARQTAGGYTWAQLTSGNWVAVNFIR